jgi:hypothetical protein
MQDHNTPSDSVTSEQTPPKQMLPPPVFAPSDYAQYTIREQLSLPIASRKALTSFFLGILGGLGWVIIIVIANIIRINKDMTDMPRAGLGLLAILIGFASIPGIIFGILGRKTSRNQLFPILGIILNSLFLAVIVFLAVLVTIRPR